MRWQVMFQGGLAAALLVLAPGCGGAKKTFPVKGSVTLDGKPVTFAQVVFMSKLGDGMSAQGLTNSDGNFELTTYQPNDGALPGEYVVVVTKVDEVQHPDLKDLPDNMTPQEIMQKVMPKVMANIAKHKLEKKTSPLPAIYGNAKRTPLKCTVPTNGKVTLNLDSKYQ